MAKRNFGGFGGGNMNGMLKQLEKAQKAMEEAQEKVDNTELTASAGGGIVEVVGNGKREIKSIKIDPEALDPEDVDMLEDMILVAINDVLSQAKELNDKELGKVTGGLNLGI